MDAPLIRMELLDGTTKWRRPPNLEHGTLCRVFGLDPCSTWFDLPSSARGVGSMVVGAGGGTNGRQINGLIFQGPKGSNPIGKLQWVREGERFRDIDPHDPRDLLELGRS